MPWSPCVFWKEVEQEVLILISNINCKVTAVIIVVQIVVIIYIIINNNSTRRWEMESLKKKCFCSIWMWAVKVVWQGVTGKELQYHSNSHKKKINDNKTNVCAVFSQQQFMHYDRPNLESNGSPAF